MKQINGIFVLMMIQLVVVTGLWAQIQSDEDIVTPTPAFQDHGGITPWFWIGVQSLFSAGYNFETGGGGFKDHGGDDDTWATFNVSFVDSWHNPAKFYEVPRGDSGAWTGRFKLLNFSSKINSWTGSTGELYLHEPAWLAEISGRGFHIGFFTQAGNLIGSLDNDQADTKPVKVIAGGNKVLSIGEKIDIGDTFFEKTDASHKTRYSGNAIFYTGYVKPELFNVYLTMLSEGSVDTSKADIEAGKNDAFAGVIDFGVSPFGLITDEEKPLTFNITGNAIGGVKWEGPAGGDNVGVGLKADTGIWLGQDNLVLSPVLAFDGRLDTANEFTWKFGGGLTFQFSGMRWVSDDWNELNDSIIANQDFRYENDKILKYAYAQVYAAYSDQTDLDLIFKAEEPDGDAGFHDKLGAMAEVWLLNLTEKDPAKPQAWAAQGRVSWDFDIKSYLVTPYARAYLDSDAVFKMRLGTQANFIPYTGFEIAYTSPNLNKGADTRAFDSGRLELIVILKSDNPRPKTLKRMADADNPGLGW